MITSFLKRLFNRKQYLSDSMNIEKEFRRVEKEDKERTASFLTENPDVNNWVGSDFESIIRKKDYVQFGDEFDIPLECWDEAMSPGSMEHVVEKRGEWTYYIVDGDEYTYDTEFVGIVVYFNDEILYPKARKILEEISKSIERVSGKDVEIILNCAHDHRYRIR
ncbi:hypothetical protein [Aureibacter tunicatorum]|uniref:Uncharacterized protein n=1 Tax=Aureibacter tunicatorum TaxID=866807 RepID=A0AAE4BU57_9BACT|nr:hypothetical protein [Aureibacter tunicatorum]MDR6241451.1 hypothetical protein [Aureibacter tunicatorum]